MKYVLAVLVVLGCGEANKRRLDCTIYGSKCDDHTTSDAEWKDVQREDSPTGSTFGIPGPSGAPGRDGQDGAPGVDGQDGAEGPQGVPGEQGVPGPAGQDGQDGVNGVDGTNGQDGTNGVDGQDGEDGEDGTDGADGTVVSIVDPCGNHPTKVDSILLVLSTGSVVSANNKGLTLLAPGVYTTSDGTYCTFTVHASGSVTW